MAERDRRISLLQYDIDGKRTIIRQLQKELDAKRTNGALPDALQQTINALLGTCAIQDKLIKRLETLVQELEERIVMLEAM